MSLELRTANKELGIDIGFIVFFGIAICLALAYLIYFQYDRDALFLMSLAIIVWIAVSLYLAKDARKQIILKKEINTEKGFRRNIKIGVRETKIDIG